MDPQPTPTSSSAYRNPLAWLRLGLMLLLVAGVGFLFWKKMHLAPVTSPAPLAEPTNLVAETPAPATASEEPTPLPGTLYYVSPSGQDTNSGRSVDAPFQSIQKAVDLAMPGETIELAPGTYFQNVVTKRNGTAEKRITLEGPRTAIIKGSGEGENHIIEVNHDFLTLDGFTVDGQAGDPKKASGYRAKLIYVQGTEKKQGVTGLRITHMLIQNSGGECVRLRYFAVKNEIAYNTIQNCGWVDFKFHGGGKNGEGIYVGTAPEQRADGKNPTTDVDVTQENWIHDNHIDTEGNECVDIKEGATANIVEKNTCTGQKDPESGGLDARGSGNVFRQNEIFGSVGAGVRLGGDKKTDGVNNFVYNNNIHENQGGGIKFMRLPQAKICGNTFANNKGGDFVGEKPDVKKNASC